jgi:hypothetical protein
MRKDDHIVGYASYDQKIRPVVVFTIVLTVVTVVVLGLMKLASSAFTREANEGALPMHPLADPKLVEVPPEPRLQETPAIDLVRFRAREDERLSTYGWVDRQGGVVRIPIDRAMQIVAHEGLPSRKVEAR